MAEPFGPLVSEWVQNPSEGKKKRLAFLCKTLGLEPNSVQVYDEKKLQFPDWTETKPLEQAGRQAQWLSKWLSSAAGDKIQAQPVIALPGLFVERTSSNGFPVIKLPNISPQC